MDKPSRTTASGIVARARRSTAGRAARRFADDGMTERAASLSFYALLSIIPVLLIAAAAIRLFGDADVADDVRATASDAGASSSVAAALRGMVQTARASSAEGAGGAGIAGLLTLFYGTSKVLTDAGRALDRIHGGAPVRRPLRKRAADFGWSVLLVVCGLLALLLVALTGRVVRSLFDWLGAGHLESWLWEIVRWPVIAAVGLAVVAVVKWAGPVSHRPRFRLFSPGNLVAVGLGLAASSGYSIYLSVFASYNATYGTFAAIIILMLWVWSISLVFLYSAEVDELLEAR